MVDGQGGLSTMKSVRQKIKLLVILIGCLSLFVSSCLAPEGSAGLIFANDPNADGEAYDNQ